MKKINGYFFTLCSVSLLACGACKKDKNNDGGDSAQVATASFTINGGGFTNQAINLTGTTSDGSYCTYFKGGKMTSINIAAKSGSSKNIITMIYNDNTPGTEHGGDNTHNGAFVPSVDFELQVVGNDGQAHNFHFSNATTTPQTITVTKYGATGATVEGTFTGTLMDGNGVSNTHITGGKFTITRGIDQD